MSTSTFQVGHTTANRATTGDAVTSPVEPETLRRPTLTTTVPKEFVHRAAVAEVMLTDWQRTSGSHFTMAAQWPRGHSFFTPVGDGYHDPLIAAETIRQAGILLGHAEFGVPLGHHFLVWDLDVTVRPGHLLVDHAPASLDLSVDCPEIKLRNGNLTALRIEVVIRRDGHVAATGGGSYTCVTPTVYRRLRARRAIGEQLPLTAPEAPQTVGRTSPVDVVLSSIGEPNRWQLRVDTRHPVLFDHPVDHVPGMVLIEAARQATAATLGRSSFLPLGITSEFKQYVELDTPCFIEANRVSDPTSGNESVLVTGRQEGAVVFRSTVTAADHGH